MPRAYLSFGSNLGNRKANLRKAVEVLKGNPYLRLRRVSSVYETKPLDYEKQRKFYNLVIAVETSLSTSELFELCQSVERVMGRQKRKNKGPRIIDVDILLYGDRRIKNENLTIPHPRLKERAFVLVPLIEISPQLKTPSGAYLSSYLKNVEDQEIKRVGNLYS